MIFLRHLWKFPNLSYSLLVSVPRCFCNIFVSFSWRFLLVYRLCVFASFCYVLLFFLIFTIFSYVPSLPCTLRACNGTMGHHDQDLQGLQDFSFFFEIQKIFFFKGWGGVRGPPPPRGRTDGTGTDGRGQNVEKRRKTTSKK